MGREGEPYDFAWEKQDALSADRSIVDQTWTGSRWSDDPDPADYADLGGDR